MMLLSRVADSLYWIGRYLERAETTSRLARVYGAAGQVFVVFVIFVVGRSLPASKGAPQLGLTSSF